jgi:hypothetical protein
MIGSHQEDFYAFATLSLNPEELRLSLKKWHGVDWEPNLISEPHSNQVLFVGLYDGSVNFLVFFEPRSLACEDTVDLLSHSTCGRNFMV